MTKIIKTNKMTRDQLIADEVNAMVEKWGERERTGAYRLAAKETTSQLRFNAALRRGENPRGRIIHNIARGNHDRGAS